VYRPGEALPSLRNMAIELQVNPNTVQRAYDELEREGLVYPQRGKGIFVADLGTTSAQTSAAETVRKAFQEGVRAGRAAGVGADEMRRIFELSLDGCGETRSQQS
jgi:GntR family transcriptional regulator